MHPPCTRLACASCVIHVHHATLSPCYPRPPAPPPSPTPSRRRSPLSRAPSPWRRPAPSLPSSNPWQRRRSSWCRSCKTACTHHVDMQAAGVVVNYGEAPPADVEQRGCRAAADGSWRWWTYSRRGGNSEVKAVHGKACGIGEQTWASPVDHACEVSPDGSVMRCLSRAAPCLLKWEDAREGSRQCVRTGWIWSGGPGACRASRAPACTALCIY